MTTWYVGVTGGIWASGTASAAVPPSGTAKDTIAEALAAAADGDVIRLSPGTHDLPAAIEKDVHLIGYGSAVTTIETASPVSVVADDTTVRIDSVNLAGTLPLRVEGKLSLYRCNAEWDAAAEIATGGAGIAVWCAKPVAAMSDAAIGNYPLSSKTPPGGRSGAKISSYRHAVELQAAAKLVKASGQKSPETWLTFADLRVRFDERTAREGLQNRLIVANATGMAYCRGGMPVHPNFRMLHDSRILQVQGVNMAVAPRNELEILYSERVA